VNITSSYFLKEQTQRANTKSKQDKTSIQEKKKRRKRKKENKDPAHPNSFKAIPFEHTKKNQNKFLLGLLRVHPKKQEGDRMARR